MSEMKNFLYEEELSYEESGFEEYELYCLFETLKEKGVNTKHFEPLMSEGE